jgi:hypothetical protein
MSRRLTALALATVLGLGSACTSDLPDEDGPEDDVIELDGEKADGEIDFRTRVRGLTVWLDPDPVYQMRDGRGVWVITGRTSKNLDGVSTFIAEDGFADARVLSPRKFEVVLDDGHEIASMLSGLRLFVTLDVADTDDDATASILLQPRTVGSTGSSKIYVWRSLLPISYGGELVYRGQASSQVDGTLTTTSTAAAPVVSFRSARHWNLDLSGDDLAQLTTRTLPGYDLELETSTGARYQRHASIRVAIRQLALTRREPAVAFPDAFDLECAADVQACLDGLDADPDTQACGSWREVSRCNVRSELPELGVAPDDTSALVAVVAAAQAALPAGQTLTFEDLYVQGSSDVPPTISQVARAYLARLGDDLHELQHEGDIDVGTLRLLMGQAHAEGFPAAADQTVFGADPVLFTLDTFFEDEAIEARTTYVLLYYPQQARLIVARHQRVD